jgi:rhomboid protease GluP
MDKRRMCPHCRAFITTSDSKCPYCGERVGPKAIQLRDTGDMIAGLIPQGRFVTTLLLIVNGGLFLACLMLGGTTDAVLYDFGAKNNAAILWGHQWWRLVTAGFLHGGFFHILMNGWVLMDLGAQVELDYGPARMIVLYVVTTIAGFAASTWWTQAPSIGASAALCGFIGAMFALGVANPSAAGREIRKQYLIWAAYILAFGLIGRFNIDNAAHIGGLVSGFAVGYVAGTPVHSSYARERFWQVAAGFCVFLTLVSFYQVAVHFSDN